MQSRVEQAVHGESLGPCRNIGKSAAVRKAARYANQRPYSALMPVPSGDGWLHPANWPSCCRSSGRALGKIGCQWRIGQIVGGKGGGQLGAEVVNRMIALAFSRREDLPETPPAVAQQHQSTVAVRVDAVLGELLDHLRGQVIDWQNGDQVESVVGQEIEARIQRCFHPDMTPFRLSCLPSRKLELPGATYCP